MEPRVCRRPIIFIDILRFWPIHDLTRACWKFYLRMGAKLSVSLNAMLRMGMVCLGESRRSISSHGQKSLIVKVCWRGGLLPCLAFACPVRRLSAILVHHVALPRSAQQQQWANEVPSVCIQTIVELLPIGCLYRHLMLCIL